MGVRSKRFATTIAVAALAGLAVPAFGQYQIAGSVSFPPSPGLPGTDDTGPNGTGNAVDYTSMVIQSYSAPAVVDTPNGSIQGEGSPYIVGTLSFVIPEGAHGSSSTTTAFAYSPTLGFEYFGQFSGSSSLNYQDSAGTTSLNGITNQPLYFHTSNLSGENASGQAIGYDSIEATDSASNSVLGRHAFMYNISSNTYASLGLTGVGIGSTGASYGLNFNYSNVNAGTSQGTYAFSTAIGVDNLGDASGTSQRYFAFGGAYQSSASSSGSLGQSTWFYNGSTGMTTETGLYGPGYSYTKTVGTGSGTFASNTDKGVDGGYEIGYVQPYIDNGNGTGTAVGSSLGEAWEYNSVTNTTTPISLYQSGQTPNIAGFGGSYGGTPLSYSYNVTSGSVTASARGVFLQALNSHGQVGAYSNYYNGTSSSKGQIAWIYTPGATSQYQQVGLTTNGFASNGTSSFVNLTASQISSVSYLNDAGMSVGTSTEYLSSAPGGTGSTGTTTVAWLTPPGGTSVQIGPSDPAHTAVSATLGSYLSDSITELTNSGLVGGTSPRFTPGTTTQVGTDSWVYDSKTGQYYILDPNAFTSSITYLSETGVAVGEYKATSTQSYFQAFEWSESTDVFVDLTSFTNETDPNITEMTNAFSYNPTTGAIFTTAQYISNGTVQSPGGGIAVLVPEPASLTLVTGFAVMSCLGRRRRSVR